MTHPVADGVTRLWILQPAGVNERHAEPVQVLVTQGDLMGAMT